MVQILYESAVSISYDDPLIMGVQVWRDKDFGDAILALDEANKVFTILEELFDFILDHRSIDENAANPQVMGYSR